VLMALWCDIAYMNSTSSISIRPARRDDFTALWALAGLDDADGVPAEPLLVAERDGEIVAARSVADGATIADPFQRTADAVELLHLRASQQLPRRAERSRGRLLARLRGRPAAVAAH
jgi:hypothetical protein